jgi:hypothetical protein
VVWGAIAIAGLPTAMTEACQYLHETLSRLPQLRRDDLVGVPPNGVYLLFEKGEYGHGGKRIVRSGSGRVEEQTTSLREFVSTFIAKQRPQYF